MKAKNKLWAWVCIFVLSLSVSFPLSADPGDFAGYVVNNSEQPILLQIGRNDGGYLLVLVPKGKSMNLPEGTISLRALPHDLRPAKVGDNILLNVNTSDGARMKISKIGDEVSLP